MTWKWWKKSAAAADFSGSATGRDVQERCEAVVPEQAPSPLPPVKLLLNYCERCGACCAFFPVAFPESDLEHSSDRRQLSEMSMPLAGARRIMRGTETEPPRCAALQGEVGVRVCCAIYACRPSTCRNFTRSWENNQGNSLCDRARGVFGLDQFSQY